MIERSTSVAGVARATCFPSRFMSSIVLDGSLPAKRGGSVSGLPMQDQVCIGGGTQVVQSGSTETPKQVRCGGGGGSCVKIRGDSLGTAFSISVGDRPQPRAREVQKLTFQLTQESGSRSDVGQLEDLASTARSFIDGKEGAA